MPCLFLILRTLSTEVFSRNDIEYRKKHFFQSFSQPCEVVILGFRKRMSILTFSAILKFPNVSVYHICLGYHIVNTKVTIGRFKKIIFTRGDISTNICIFILISLSELSDIERMINVAPLFKISTEILTPLFFKQILTVLITYQWMTKSMGG
jgi:hypothetical protein